jgi:hypothetical protein
MIPMKYGMKIAAALFFVLLSISPASAQGLSRSGPMGFSDFQPGPQLIYPLGDELDLSGKGFLEFKWRRDTVYASRYIFKLYKGHSMYESALILKQEVSARQISCQVRSDLLEEGEVYTWSLTMVFFSGNKSDKSFSSFKIIKK